MVGLGFDSRQVHVTTEENEEWIRQQMEDLKRRLEEQQ